MSTRYFILLLLLSIITSGCNVFEGRTLGTSSESKTLAVPPYWQSQSASSQLAKDQLDQMRAFHEKESAIMSDNIHVFRNREVERMAAESKAMPKNTLRAEREGNTTERKETWAWLNWFNKKKS